MDSLALMTRIITITKVTDQCISYTPMFASDFERKDPYNLYKVSTPIPAEHFVNVKVGYHYVAFCKNIHEIQWMIRLDENDSMEQNVWLASAFSNLPNPNALAKPKALINYWLKHKYIARSQLSTTMFRIAGTTPDKPNEFQYSSFNKPAETWTKTGYIGTTLPSDADLTYDDIYVTIRLNGDKQTKKWLWAFVFSFPINSSNSERVIGNIHWSYPDPSATRKDQANNQVRKDLPNVQF